MIPQHLVWEQALVVLALTFCGGFGWCAGTWLFGRIAQAVQKKA
jgi:hypothetical protein